MKIIRHNILKTFITFALLIICFLANINLQVKAQSQGSINISPAIVDITPGQAFELLVSNNSEADVAVKLEPILLKYENNKVMPDELSFQQKLGEPFSNYINIAEHSDQIKANSQVTIKVSYLKQAPNAIIGIKVSALNNQNAQISIGGDLISILVDNSRATISDISTDLKIGNSLKIGNIYFSSGFELTTNIENISSNIYKPSGQIYVVDSEKRIGNISLTQTINQYMLPGESVQVKSDFSDTRSLFSKFGEVKFLQILDINGDQFTIEKTIFILPIELLAFGLVILIGVIFGLKSYSVRKGNIYPKTKLKKQISSTSAQRVRIGERKIR